MSEALVLDPYPLGLDLGFQISLMNLAGFLLNSVGADTHSVPF